MSQEEATALLQGLQEYVGETTESREQALAALQEAGLVNDQGQPQAPYAD